MKTAVSAGILVAVLFCALVSPPVVAQGNTQARVLTKDQWREDLRHFAKELPRRHKNLFHSVSREDFQRAVAELDAAIPSLQEHQIIVGMLRISARVGDGHTGVRLPPYFKLYPLSLYWFGRDLRVIGAAKEYQAAIGARVVKIGGVDLAEVQARIRTCLPSAENENEWYVLGNSPAFINRPEVLHALGIVPDVGPTSFTLADDTGKEFVLEISPVAMPPIVKGVARLGLDSAARIEPLSRQKPMETFWFTHLQDSETTYVNFRRYDSLGDRARPLFQSIDRNPPKRLVIDLRQNGGGDFFVGRKHLVNPVKERPSVNQKGRLFVIVGRRTFSAAMVNAIDFRKQTNAILVGEPIGERPNSYSENDEMTLPNSRLVVSYSTEYYKFLDEDVPAVMPDHRIDPTWPDFQAGRDPVMEWILAQGR